MTRSSLWSISLLAFTTLGSWGCMGQDGPLDSDDQTATSRQGLETLAGNSKLAPSDVASDDNFGVSLAMDGNTVLVGAYRADISGVNAGSAYVFVRDASGWREQAKLTPSDGTAYDYFGFTVAIDGDTAVVGAYLHDGVRYNGGAVYVFTREAGVWTQQAKLRASDAYVGQLFGTSVSIHKDTLVVGAPGDPQGGHGAGAIYVFVRNGAAWKQQDKLVALDAMPGQSFGRSVAVYEDTILVGADGDAVGSPNSGAAYVFIRNFGIWTEQDKFKPFDAESDEYFGFSVALNEDTAVIGAPRDHEANWNTGALYVYKRSDWWWLKDAKLFADDAPFGANFGWSVELSGDTIVAGAPRDIGMDFTTGSARVFSHNGVSWTETTKLTAGDGEFYDFFGFGVAASDGMVMVGSPRDSDHGPLSGSAYAFNMAGPASNSAPSADAGEAQSLPCVSGGDSRTVTLDGSGSTDDDGDALLYRWYKDGVQIADGIRPAVSLGAGSHTIKLVVSDGELESSAEVLVSIEDCAQCAQASGSVWDACSPECPCESGVGDCDSDAECVEGARCMLDVGLSYGYSIASLDVCVAGCPVEGAGSWSYCSPECPCDEGMGDCDSDAECADGLRCMQDIGALYGYASTMDVCVAACPSDLGSLNYCSPQCPCAAGEGDCDSDSDCLDGLSCVTNGGASYGMDGVDVCQ